MKGIGYAVSRQCMDSWHRAISVSADSASQIGRFETQWLSRADYLENLAPSRRTLRRVYQKEVLRCRSGITDSFGGAMLRAVASGIIQSSLR